MVLLVDDSVAARGRRRAGTRWVLGERMARWVSAGVVAHTLWTSAAPAMVYPLYAAQWHLTHVTITGIFAIYPVVVVAVLVAFGDISDHLGRRAAMLLGLAASLSGVLLFAVAPSVSWLFVGRALMGIGVGLTAAPSTAAVLEFSGSGGSRSASSLTTAAQAAGFAAALLMGGALVEYAPLPTRLCFWLLFGVIGILFAGTWFLPRHVVIEAKGRWQPQDALRSAQNAIDLCAGRPGDYDGLHPWRADPFARRPGSPPSGRIEQRVDQRRRAGTVCRGVGSDRPDCTIGAIPKSDSAGLSGVGPQHGGVGSLGVAASIDGFPGRHPPPPVPDTAFCSLAA
ncbi:MULTISPECIES: MFS transporter [unclassified Bradyrhizobium]|uniref:MFS transporter n=1 Tax=unclassified Bradyrhizobium TaxID=2631580 RepID=UPI003395B6E1